MGIYPTEFFGSSTLGLSGVCSENMCYLPKELPKHQVQKIAESLEAPIRKVSFYNSSLLGLFSATNSRYLFVPEIISEEELKDVGKEVITLPGQFTTIGNLILCNDKGCILSPYLSRKRVFFQKELGLKTIASTISDLPFPGVFAYVTNKAGIVHQRCRDSELDVLEKTLGVPFKRCEFYDGFPGAEILANSKGLIVPRLIRGQEMAEIQEGLKIF